ncbi:hypothetical protein QJS10_CPB11g01345 [Acorus calamus]|uniref:tRNA-splicing endonuclease subunit Sen54 N-terminal domain-containing protein n=1 Tax=Acorus calamus TaxID=4465 RepID=A0AAV9DV02_ACOCL|nr:hypothetical protein QJS10_CPB11g01345 [Acorus calamus]
MEHKDWKNVSSSDEESNSDFDLQDMNVEERHQNPYSTLCTSLSKLQFRKDISKAVWCEDVLMAEVIAKKGSIWATTGVVRSSKIYCLIEEIAFLAERGALILVDVRDTVLSLNDIYNKLSDENNGCCWESFEAYRHLKSLGYIVGRHGLPWSLKKDENSGSSVSLKCTLENDEKKPNFDVYPPDSKFKKTSPGNPSFMVYVLRGDLPSKPVVEQLERECSGTLLKFCYVDHGRVSFFSTDKVELPVLL